MCDKVYFVYIMLWSFGSGKLLRIATCPVPADSSNVPRHIWQVPSTLPTHRAARCTALLSEYGPRNCSLLRVPRDRREANQKRRLIRPSAWCTFASFNTLWGYTSMSVQSLNPTSANHLSPQVVRNSFRTYSGYRSGRATGGWLWQESASLLLLCEIRTGEFIAKVNVRKIIKSP